MSSSRIIEMHLGEASFLWTLRERAVRDAAYDLPALADLDARIDAHLDGLVLAGAEASRAFATALEDPEPGSVFAATFVAVSCRGTASVAEACRRGSAVGDVIELAVSSPPLLRAATAALGWLPRSHLLWLLPSLLDPSREAERRSLGIAGAAAHRYDPGAALVLASDAQEAPLRARALKACAELGRTDVDVAASYGAEDGAVRFWALWAGTLRRDSRATELLWAVAESDSAFAERACTTLMRATAPTMARRWLESLAPRGQLRKALIGAAALGDPALVPWALELLPKPELARLAAETVRRITGIDCEAGPLRSKPPAGFRSGPSDDPEDEDVEMDPDDGLPWPNASAVEASWRVIERNFATGQRYSAGKPVTTPGWLDHLLRHGRQPVRRAAAEEIALQAGRGALFEVRARAARQQRELAHG